ncbi:hypothetical protein, partial [Falsiroseomonas oryzae]
PLEPEAEWVAARVAAAAAAVEAAQAAAAEVAAESTRLEADRAQLARGETVPTREVIAAARAQRDHAWRLLRRALEGDPSAAESREGLPDGPLPDLFETLRDTADRLADTRADDAGRVTAYAEKTARLGWLAARRGDVAAELQSAEARLREAEAAWTALWSPAGLQPQGAAAMQAWRRQRAEVLRLAAAEAEAMRRRDDLATRIAEARAGVLALLPEASSLPTLAALLDRAEDDCAAQEAAE